jgi:hypothetical protein
VTLRRRRTAPCDTTGTRGPQLSLASPLAVRLTRVVLWALVALGGAGGLVGALRSAPSVAERAAPRETLPPTLAGVAETAARRWLANPEPNTLPSTSPRLTVDAVSAIAIRPVTADYWAVAVLAVVRPTAAAAAREWYLVVGVAAVGDALRPVGEPAIVPAPSDLRPVEPAADTERVLASDDPMAATATAFLRALLTGNADPVRYAAPGTHIAAIAEPPFAEITVDRVAVTGTDGAGSRLRVSLAATTAARSSFDLTYEVAMAQRAGRWEVTALHGAPSRPPVRARPPATTSTAASTASPTPSSSTTAPPPAQTPAPEPGA